MELRLQEQGGKYIQSLYRYLKVILALAEPFVDRGSVRIVRTRTRGGC
jgi:hypothetical protein